MRYVLLNHNQAATIGPVFRIVGFDESTFFTECGSDSNPVATHVADIERCNDEQFTCVLIGLQRDISECANWRWHSSRRTRGGCPPRSKQPKCLVVGLE